MTAAPGPFWNAQVPRMTRRRLPGGRVALTPPRCQCNFRIPQRGNWWPAVEERHSCKRNKKNLTQQPATHNFTTSTNEHFKPNVCTAQGWRFATVTPWSPLAHPSVPAGHPQYTGAQFTWEGCGWPKPDHKRATRCGRKHTFTSSHGSGAYHDHANHDSLVTRRATTQEPPFSGTTRFLSLLMPRSSSRTPTEPTRTTSSIQRQPRQSVAHSR